MTKQVDLADQMNNMRKLKDQIPHDKRVLFDKLIKRQFTSRAKMLDNVLHFCEWIYVFLFKQRRVNGIAVFLK